MHRKNLTHEAGIGNKCIDYAGLYIIGVISLAYAMFYRNIAKVHIDLPFVKAPLFIGEAVFAACLCLFFIKWYRGRKSSNMCALLFWIYCGFVISKTAIGYCAWGPLALRHAVLFAYPLFAVMSYSFYRSGFFTPNRILAIVLPVILIFSYIYFHSYCLVAVLVLMLILIRAYPRKNIGYILTILLLSVFPYKYFFQTSRTFIASNLAAGLYMGLGLLYVSKVKTVYKVTACLVFVVFVLYGVFNICNRNEIRSIVAFGDMMKRYNEAESRICNREKTFVAPDLKVKLFNEETGWGHKVKEGSAEENPAALAAVVAASSAAPKEKPVSNNAVSPAKIVESKTKTESSAQKDALKENGSKKYVIDRYTKRFEDTPYENSLFRIFMWKDLIQELAVKRPVFGFDFGKPFRSRSLEVLYWGGSEWSRDGWVCMHNSYLDIIYRAGIPGILMVFSILASFLVLITRSFYMRSPTGILLTGILMNWLMAANFLEILEMPYSAIPLWSLFGMTAAYLFKDKYR